MPAEAGADLRVLTYNVRGLRDDRAALVRVVRTLDPDVVCLQEAPRLLRWRPRLAALARDCELTYVAGGGTTGGTALLAHLRVGVDLVEEHRLTKHRGLHQRGLAVARVRIGAGTAAGTGDGSSTSAGGHLEVASIHLGLDAAERVRHTGEVLALLQGRDASVGGAGAPHRFGHRVLAGDLNEAPGGPAWTRLAAAGLIDACASARGRTEVTFSARNPRRRIDAVFASAGLGLVHAGVPLDLVEPADLVAASDHRPVLAVLHLPLHSRS